MKSFLDDLKFSLEKIDNFRDRVLFLFIKPYWPRKITPNQITYVRLVIGVILFALLFFFNIENKALIISLFCVGILTDLFDGSVARGLNEITDFGTMLDPVADRMLIVPIAVYSLLKFQKWLLLALIVEEIIGALIVLFQKSREKNVSPNIFGKTKMFLVSVVFAAILVFWPAAPSPFFIDVLWLAMAFAFVSIFARVLELNKQGHIKNKIINKEINKLKDENL